MSSEIFQKVMEEKEEKVEVEEEEEEEELVPAQVWWCDRCELRCLLVRIVMECVLWRGGASSAFMS